MNEQLSENNAFIAPCQNACPVKTRARDYVRLVAFNRLEEAYEVITENNPFPSVCGRVCMHPCEEACRRNQVDEPISIASLKRYAADYVNENKLFLSPLNVNKSGMKVAIIGAGPSGLAAALKLAEAGHEVKVFEKNKKAGGMLRYGIPKYRLSDDALDEDVKRIEAKGVEIITGTKIGDQIRLEELEDEHDAILISVGLSDSRSLPIEGIDAKGVLSAIPFLKACSDGEKVGLGKKVLVIGGGNVAIDVARSARRINPDAEITMACLESDIEMPASPWEIEEAEEEGISIRNCMGPRKVDVDEAGKVIGMNFITCASVFDEEGRFSPSFDEDKKHYIEANSIIISIGQQSDLSFISEGLQNKGRLIFDNDTMAVSDEGVFTCGEVAKGPGAAIAAIANGNLVAKAINQFLAGEAIDLEEEEDKVIPALPQKTAKHVKRKDRQKNEQVEADKRIKNFDEFDLGLNKRTSVKEALRCMDCGSGAGVDVEKCVSCLTCVRVCPFKVAEIDKKTNAAKTPIEGCQACGACAAECPASAIDLAGYPLDGIIDDIVSAIGKKKPDAIGFLCQTGKDFEMKNTQLVRVKCPIRLDDMALLKPFELGAKKVFVICHTDEGCRYKEGPRYIKRRVGYLKQILDNIGIGAKNIEVFKKSDKEDIKAFVNAKTEDKKEKVKA